MTNKTNIQVALGLLMTAALLASNASALLIVREGDLVDCVNPDLSGLTKVGDGYMINSLNSGQIGCEDVVPVEEAQALAAPALVDATSSASKWGGYCEDATGALYACYFAEAHGRANAGLGLGTGTLSGSAGSVPLADSCMMPGVETSCTVSASAWEYPGSPPPVTGSVTAAAPYGADTAPFSA